MIANSHRVVESIESFKESGTAKENGINYAHVIATHLHGSGWRALSKAIVFSLFFHTKTVFSENRSADALIFYSSRYKKRNDCDFIFAELCKWGGNECSTLESSEEFSPSQIFATLGNLSRGWRLSSGYKQSPLKRLSAALLISKYLVSAKQVNLQILGKFGRLFTFCDAFPMDNLLAQKANSLSIYTYTIQHGQYRVLGKANFSADVEAYANFVSSKMLCWGAATIKEFTRVNIPPERMIVVGWIRVPVRKKEITAPRQKFGLMLNGPNSSQSNIALIACAKYISKRLGIRFIMRLHPMTKVEQYSEIAGEMCEAIGHYAQLDYLQLVDFSLAHMTATTVEMLMVSSPVYLLDDGHLAEVFKVPGLSFGSSEEMLKAIELHQGDADGLNQHCRKLACWFNDDVDQSDKVKSLISSGKISRAVCL